MREEAQQRWQRLREEWQAIPFWRLLGIRLLHLEEGRALLGLNVEERLYAPGNVLHGGFLVSLIDTAVGSALKAYADLDDVAVVTLDTFVSYLRSVSQGEILAEGRIVRKGRAVAVGEGEVRGQQGQVLARGTSTYMIQR